jgi:actin-related protein 6
MKHAALRIDVGGKLLSNLFCEMISTKDFNLHGEFMIVNDIKERTNFLCENKSDFDRSMEYARMHQSKNPIKKEYLLPDFKKNKKGLVLDRS